MITTNAGQRQNSNSTTGKGKANTKDSKDKQNIFVQKRILEEAFARVAKKVGYDMNVRIEILPTHKMSLSISDEGSSIISNSTDTVIRGSSALVRKLDERELEATIAHEIGHSMRLHGAIDTGAVFIGLAGTLLPIVGGIIEIVGVDGAAPNLLLGAGLALAGVAFGFLSIPAFMFISRIHEYAADKYAAKLLGTGKGFISFLQKVMDSRPKRETSFLERLLANHPPPQKRIDRLLKLEKKLEEKAARESQCPKTENPA
ncbi:MAG: M48 family metalloprotease [Candidatus Micrarchaeia archaeon]